MTPDQCKIAGLLVDLGILPSPAELLAPPLGEGGRDRRQATQGLQWVWAETMGWIPNLCDSATGGVLLAMLRAELGTSREAVIEMDHRSCHLYVQLTDRATLTHESGATLAEAAARALLSLRGGP